MLETPGLSRSDGKRPEGVTITPRQAGHTPMWDAYLDTYAASHVTLAIREKGAVTTAAESRTTSKFEELAKTHHVAPLAVETSVNG